MTVEKITSPISELQLINKTNEIIDEKQDVLTAGPNISIVDVPHIEPIDTRSTATVQTVGTTSRTWQEVCYGNGKWVAVGNGGYMCVSTDGTTWGTPFTVETATWRGIIYVNNKFIAVGASGKVATSQDGTTWTTQTINNYSNITLYAITYSNNLYVIVGNSLIATSTDGETWTTQTPNSEMRGITYGNGKYVIVGTATATYSILVSTDGETWIPSKPFNKGLNDIIYAFNKFIAVGASGTIATSTDGTTWTTQTVGTIEWQELRYNNGILVISGNNGYTSTSTDGETWTTPVLIGSISWYGLDNNGSNYVAVGVSGGMTSFQVVKGQEGGTFISAVVDSTLSSTSENPVQNKAVYNAIEAARSTITFRDWS